MPQKSGFFDSIDGDERLYPARDFANYFAQIISNGVFKGGQFLNPTSTGMDNVVNISPGYAWINGYAYSVYDSALTLTIPAANAQDRIDRIILRLDTSTPVRLIQAIVIQGTPSMTPLPPALVRTGDIYDISLAKVMVTANSTIISQSDITDERLDTSVCGLVNSLVTVDTTVFEAQWKEFMDSIKDDSYATYGYVNEQVLTGGYGVTANNNNAYTVVLNPSPTGLVAGLSFSVKINASNTGAATINVNGFGAKRILKPNGNDVVANGLRANSVYSLVYSGTDFILQGEGGEYGTATAGEVLAGKTIGTDFGIVTGTMPNRGSTNIQSQVATTVQIPAGYYNGSGVVLAAAIIAGDYLIATTLTNAERKGSQTTFQKATKWFTVNRAGQYRVSFNLASALASNGINYPTYGVIYKNGSPIGTQRTAMSTTFTNFAQDFTFVAGDTIEVWIAGAGGSYSEPIVRDLAVSIGLGPSFVTSN